jgi:DMSO/TMAO reductase YedYZ molybdopterin-dependent catalytic subunit
VLQHSEAPKHFKEEFWMERQDISRRKLLKGGGAGLAGLTVLQVAGPTQVLGQTTGDVIPWLDQPPGNPVPAIVGNLLRWEDLDTRLTPAQNFFYVNHYGVPRDLDEASWRIEISGLVAQPRTLTMQDLRARERHEVEFTLECAGNNGFEFLTGAIGNARWGGARLAPLLQSVDVLNEGTEVVFWGADRGQETIRDNSGILSGGLTGVTQPDTGGGADLTITEQFARSMSLREALNRDNLLCYEMNGVALPLEHGFPVRLIAPGWYGVANVKWLTRIEVIDHRYAGKFMARDYVSIREERRNNQTVWTFTTVGRDRLKSAPAKVTRLQNRYTVMGAAWGAPIAGVEVQIDSGPWMRARLLDPPESPRSARYAWRFWSFDWGMPTSGEHQIRSRAIDLDGNVQPAQSDPYVSSRRTFWENNGHISRRVLIP